MDDFLLEYTGPCFCNGYWSELAHVILRIGNGFCVCMWRCLYVCVCVCVCVCARMVSALVLCLCVGWRGGVEEGGGEYVCMCMCDYGRVCMCHEQLSYITLLIYY